MDTLLGNDKFDEQVPRDVQQIKETNYLGAIDKNAAKMLGASATNGSLGHKLWRLYCC